MLRIRSIPLLLGLCLVTGCSKIPPADDGTVFEEIYWRINNNAEWRQDCCYNQEYQEFIDNALANKLTADSAIQIALFNNPKVQATFQELGIARADLVAAGLLSNPSFELEIRYPNTQGLKTNIEYLITSSLLDLFLIPLRRQMAELNFQQTKLEVAHTILNLAFDVRETFYELIAEQKKIDRLQSILELTSIINEIFSKQIEVGNINSLEFQLSQLRLLEGKQELLSAQTHVIQLREKLNRLLGFNEDIFLNLPENLPDVDYCGFDLCTLESIALEERLDLQVARFEIIALRQKLGLKEWWSYSNLKVGISGERDTDGTNVIGPGFSGELPIFNYGQADRMRLIAELKKAQENLAVLEIKALSEVREAHKLLMSYLQMVKEYQNQLIPMQEQVSTSSEQLYNVMGIGIDKLLENKRIEMRGKHNYSEIVKKYLVARVELDRALGGNLFVLLSKQECLKE